MAVPASLIPELEEVLQHGSAERRTRTLQRITSLFLNAADQFSEQHVSVFDSVFVRLIDEIETKARAELSHRLAPVSNAPIEAVRLLARDVDISVAGPVLKQSSRVPEADLVEIAKSRGQAHLLAISERTGIAEVITEQLVRRGDRQVVRSVAGNPQARISERSFSALVNRAEKDVELAETVGTRPDIPPRLFRELVLRATEVVQERLLAAAEPDTQAEIRRVLAKVSQEIGVAKRRDYTTAERTIDALRQQGKLNEGALVEFANARQHEEAVVALARLCSVPIDVIDRLMGGNRADPILILCRSMGWEWPTAKALIQARSDGTSTPSHTLDSAFSNFERLSPATAQRVARFWRARPALNAELS